MFFLKKAVFEYDEGTHFRCENTFLTYFIESLSTEEAIIICNLFDFGPGQSSRASRNPVKMSLLLSRFRVRFFHIRRSGKVDVGTAGTGTGSGSTRPFPVRFSLTFRSTPLSRREIDFDLDLFDGDACREGP